MLRFLVLVVLSALIHAGTVAQNRAAVMAYIDRYRSLALQNEKDFGIPATIILAQGILESGAGTSELTRNSNNHFGIKALGNSWTGGIYRAWDDEAQKSKFRVYSSAEESYNDHARLLTNGSRYRQLFNLSVYDYRGWAHGLKKAGYATAPDYAEALIGLIDSYRLYEINGGAKLRPGKKITFTRVVEVVDTIYGHVSSELDAECILSDDEETEEQEMVEKAQSRYVASINNVRCTIIQPGEDLKSVVRKYDISIQNILTFNDVAFISSLKEGDVVFLEKKKRVYEGPQDVFIAMQDMSLHEISQQYGVQLSRLAKINNLKENATVRKGSRIKLK